MQELDKFNLKINVIPNGLEKYMSFNINNKLVFIDSFQFLSSSLDSLVLDLVQQKKFCPYVYMSDFVKFKEELRCKEKFYTSLAGKKLVMKNMTNVPKVWNKFKMKTIKDYLDLYLKYDALLLADVLEKFRNNSLKNYGLCLSHYLSAPL